MNSINTKPLEQLLKPVYALIEPSDVSELMINGPDSVFLERGGEIQKVNSDNFSLEHLSSLVALIASYTGQKIDENTPLLSAMLPSGERVQVVMPPATLQGIIAISIRKQSSLELTVEDYEKQGAFTRAQFSSRAITEEDEELLELKRTRNIKRFIEKAILFRKNIVLSGATSSGKTTFLNAMVKLIPRDQRIITIEDVHEARIPHENKIHLMYSKDGQGRSDITAAKLMEVCMRMRPDRIIPQEIRGAEAFNFLELVSSGHPGSITSLHANSASEAEKKLVFMCLRAGSGLTKAELSSYISSTIDIIIQWERVGAQRLVTDIYYEPQ